jgi:hypothetical protein
MSIPLRVFTEDVPEARALKRTIRTLVGRPARGRERPVVVCSDLRAFHVLRATATRHTASS